MLVCGWSEEKRRDQLLQSRSIVLSTIDTGHSMIGNINKRGSQKKANCRPSFYSFFFSSFAACNRDTVLGSCNRFVGIRPRAIATYADSSPGATGRFRQWPMSRLESVQDLRMSQRHSVVLLLLPFCFGRSSPGYVRIGNSIRCLLVLRSGEPEETRGVMNAAHCFVIASQRVPTQFSRFQITSRRLFPFALKFTTLRQRSPVSSS